MPKKILRIFPTETRATPDDENVRIRCYPTLFDDADEVHISVAFTWDIPWAEKAARAWQAVAPVKVGGPAYNEVGGDFVPGMYMKKGYVITSRGCPNRCWFCSVPKREGGQLRELPVTDGWILTDDNLLACSDVHIDRVFEMLARQPHRPEFCGGLEAKLLTPVISERLHNLKPRSIYFAYDTPNDYEPLVEAGKMLFDAGFTRSAHHMYAYVLCGWKKDTIDQALKRMHDTWRAGFVPMAMLYRDFKGEYDKEWKAFQREWANPKIRGVKLKEIKL